MKNNDDITKKTETIRLYTGEELDVDSGPWEPEADVKPKKDDYLRRIEILRKKKIMFKRLTVLVAILAAFLSSMAVLSYESYTTERRLSQRVDELEQNMLALQTSITELTEEEVNPDNIVKLATVYGYDKEGKKAIDENSVYYDFTYDDLWSMERVDDEVVSLVVGIAKVYYFTAGSSLQLMDRGADFAIIAHKGEESWQNISAHLDTMTAAQLDFLSFRMLDAYYYALDLINGGSAVEQLEEAGVSSKAYEGCTEVELARFLGFMIELFDEKGVEYEWQTYNIMSVFS